MNAADDTNQFAPQEWETVKDCVFACESIHGAARREYLDRHCGADNIRQEVERLLLASDQAKDFLERPAGAGLLNSTTPVKTAADEIAGPAMQVGRFRILRELGQGGTGIVYAAMDHTLGRSVALKVLHQAAADNREFRQRLLWDALAASRLNHPNIVTIYEAGTEGNVDYVAMEHLSGGTLAEILAAGPLSQQTALNYAVQIAKGLEAAHHGGIVHRDLKPSNIILTEAGDVKIVDFGLAKSIGPFRQDVSPPTIQGSFGGTVAYSSPEQAEGRELDTRCDIFSFGSVLYEILTGRKAFPGGNAVAVLASVIHTEPAPPSSVKRGLDARLDQILGRCLRKDRERRFQNIEDVRVQLQEILDGREISRSRVSRYRMWGAALAAGLALVAIGWMSQRFSPSPVASGVTLMRLNSEAGLNEYPSLSSDGRFLAYSSDRRGDGNLDIWIQPIGGGDPTRLTSDPADDVEPSFSPDGNQIVYRSNRQRGGVYLSRFFSNSGQLLVPDGKNPYFSPDGSQIACWTGRVGGTFYPDSARVQIVSVASGQRRPFNTDFLATAYPIWISGSRIIFLGRGKVADGSSPVDWWIADTNGGRPVKTGALDRIRRAGLSTAPGEFWVRPEAFDSRAGAVLFTATHGDAVNIWQLALDGSGHASKPPDRVTTGASFDAWPSVSGDGVESRLVYSNLVRDVSLWRLNLNKAGIAQGLPERMFSGYLDISSPSVTRDGHMLLFAVRQAGGERIISLDPALSEPHAITTTVQASHKDRVLATASPMVSGDGRSMAFLNDRTVYSARLPDGLATPLCDECSTPTDVNFDGTKVILESRLGDDHLLLWLDGHLRSLVNGFSPPNTYQFAGRFSPDSKWAALVLLTRNSEARHIEVVPVNPGRDLTPEDWIRISDDSESDRNPVWSADGRYIYYLSDQDGFRCLWGRPIDPKTGHPTGPARALAHFHHARFSIGGFKAKTGEIGPSAAGDFLVFSVSETTGNIWSQRRAGGK